MFDLQTQNYADNPAKLLTFPKNADWVPLSWACLLGGRAADVAGRDEALLWATVVKCCLGLVGTSAGSLTA